MQELGSNHHTHITSTAQGNSASKSQCCCKCPAAAFDFSPGSLQEESSGCRSARPVQPCQPPNLLPLQETLLRDSSVSELPVVKEARLFPTTPMPFACREQAALANQMAQSEDRSQATPSPPVGAYGPVQSDGGCGQRTWCCWQTSPHR